jgi:predicted SnoaL-like aldol condensation-catalyzing enzyme
MRIVTTMFSALLGLLVVAASAAAQQPARQPIVNPTPGCTATPAQLEEVRKAGIAFTFSQGAERVALADPTYKQHNPAFVKGAREAGMNDYDYFKARFGGPPAARQGGAAPAAGAGRGAAAGPQPPPGNPTEIVMAECDLVTIIHKNYRQDPTAPPGTWYEAFTFDTFRVRNGKLIEHWDSAVINPPAAAPAGAPAGGRGN